MARSITQAPAPTDNGPTFQTFAQHQREITVALVKKAEADSVVQHAYRRAKSAGINIDQLKAALKAKKLDVEQVAMNVRDFAQYLLWLDVRIGTQASFLGATPPPEEGVQKIRVQDAEQAGYEAGTKGHEISACPYKPGEELHAAWVRGLHKGVAFMEGRGGDAPPRVEEVAARGRGSRGKAAKATKEPKGTVVVMPDRSRGGRRRVEFPPEVPEVSPQPAEAANEDDAPGPAFH